MNCLYQLSTYTPKNQNQFVFDFGFDTNSKSYNDGYNTGYTWDANWMPGGPFVFTAKPYESEAWKKECADSKLKHDEWMQGFKDGLKERLATNKHFARWWNTNKNYRGNEIKKIRYLMIENIEAKNVV